MARKSYRWDTERYDGIRPIHAVASRILRTDNAQPLPNPEKLRERAERARNPKRKRALILETEHAEKNLRAIKGRMAGPKAEARARRALEAAKWRRENTER